MENLLKLSGVYKRCRDVIMAITIDREFKSLSLFFGLRTALRSIQRRKNLKSLFLSKYVFCCIHPQLGFSLIHLL